MNLQAKGMVTNATIGRHVGGLDDLAKDCHYSD
jgi:hypothetical protein